jgi:hypothetical protein
VYITLNLFCFLHNARFGNALIGAVGPLLSRRNLFWSRRIIILQFFFFLLAPHIHLTEKKQHREERRSDCPLEGYHDSTHIPVASYAHLVFIFIYWGQWNLKRIEFTISALLYIKNILVRVVPEKSHFLTLFSELRAR